MALAPSDLPRRDSQPNVPSPSRDPFWQSTPRTARAALMSPVQQQPARGPASATPTPPRRLVAGFRRPQCTHVTMNRVYGAGSCVMCGRIPDMGWLYVCQQDQQLGQHDPLPDIDAIPIPVSDDDDCFAAKARVAEHLRMGSDVIRAIRSGNYRVDQVHKLVSMRENVIKVINERQGALSDQAPAASDLIASVGVGATHSTTSATNLQPITPPQTPTRTEATKLANGQTKSPCNFQVCHTCRPFFQDRSFSSFEAVLNGEIQQLSLDDVQSLPVIDYKIALRWGLPRPPGLTKGPVSEKSMDMTSSYNYDDDEISVDWTHTTTTNNDSDSGSERLDGGELYPCPGPGQCPVWSRYSGCAYDSGFDDGRRAMNHGFLAEHEAERLTPENSRSQLRRMLGSIVDTPGASSTASSISLPTPLTSPLTPLLPEDDTFEMQYKKVGATRSFSSGSPSQEHKLRLRGKDSNSSLGSEVEVEGGVALKEEAVESRVPDIVTAN